MCVTGTVVQQTGREEEEEGWVAEERKRNPESAVTL